MAGKRFKVQVSKGKGSYVTRYSYPTVQQAERVFSAFHADGYNKRVYDSHTGAVVYRVKV
jgi:hypothetical protein